MTGRRIGPLAAAAALVAAGLATSVLAGATAVPARRDAQEPPPLFRGHDDLAVTLTADFAQLVRDRRESPDRPAVVTVLGADGAPDEISARLRTRGEFRLDPSNCSFPPLRLDVDGSEAAGTVFDGQDELKIVSSCRPGRPSYDRLVVLEYLTYRMYGVLTDRSFRVRPVMLTLVDTGGERETETRWGFLIEEDRALARRFEATVFDLEEGKNLPADAFDRTSAVMTAVFEYLVGNPDWSEVAGHNVEILDRGGAAIAVPYDFDFSGFVDAPYATPPEELGLSSVRERYYRGWCSSAFTHALVLRRFREVRAEMLELVASEPRLDDLTRGRALRYVESGFDDIETDDRADRRVFRSCRTAD